MNVNMRVSLFSDNVFVLSNDVTQLFEKTAVRAQQQLRITIRYFASLISAGC